MRLGEVEKDYLSPNMLNIKENELKENEISDTESMLSGCSSQRSLRSQSKKLKRRNTITSKSSMQSPSGSTPSSRNPIGSFKR